MRLTKGLLTLLLALAVLTTGCASKYGDQKTQVNYFPACYAPIQDLRDHEYDETKGTVGGAAMGALAGALIGLAAEGSGRGALIGALGGGVAGAVAGNIWAKKSRESDDNKRLASYLQDLDGDISNLDATGAAARTSLQCYDRQFAILLKEIKAKQVTKTEAQQRFAEIRDGREEAIAILGQAVAQGEDLNQQYQEAFANEDTILAARGTTAASSASGAAPTAAKTAKKTGTTAKKTATTAKKASTTAKATAPAQKTAAQNTPAQNLQVAKQRSGDLVAKTDALAAEKMAAERTTAMQMQEIEAGLNDLRT